MTDAPLVGRVHSVEDGVVRVIVPSVDGGASAKVAFASSALQAGDEVRVAQDERGGYVVVSDSAGRRPVGWTTPTLLHGWTAGANPVGYTLRPDGTVRLRGLIRSGADLTTVFTLPVGYQPGHDVVFVVFQAFSFHATLLVQADGGVIVGATSSTSNDISLDSVSFLAEH